MIVKLGMLYFVNMQMKLHKLQRGLWPIHHHKSIFQFHISLQDFRIRGQHEVAQLTQYVKQVCEKVTVNRTDGEREQSMFKKMCLIPSKKFFYCPVEKVGSTFWWRVMYMLARPSKEYKQPFEVQIPAVLTLKHTGYDPQVNYTDWSVLCLQEIRIADYLAYMLINS